MSVSGRCASPLSLHQRELLVVWLSSCVLSLLLTFVISVQARGVSSELWRNDPELSQSAAFCRKTKSSWLFLLRKGFSAGVSVFVGKVQQSNIFVLFASH